MIKNLSEKILYGFIFGLSAVVFISAIVYKIYALNWIGIIFSLALPCILITKTSPLKALNKTEKIKELAQRVSSFFKNKQNFSWPDSRRSDLFLLLAYFTANFSFLYFVWLGRTDEAIISPWQTIDAWAFGNYFLANLFLITFILKSASNRLVLAVLSWHCLSSFSIALIVYRLGYGFDPFIHQATLELIDKTGSVSPKPFYYLGQYGLTMILHKVFFLPIAWTNRFLTPILASFTLPIIIRTWAKKFWPHQKSAQLLGLSLLILPFSFFILSTPQNLAFLWSIWLIFLAPLATGNWLFLSVTTLACLSIHPLAGLPALFFLLFTFVSQAKLKQKRFFNLAILAISSLALPLAFWLIGRANLSSDWLGNFNWGNLKNIINLPYQENIFLNTVYLYGFNLGLFIVALSALGFFLAKKYSHQANLPNLKQHFWATLSSLASYLFLKTLDFKDLINYEQSDYANRALLLATIFSLPAIALALLFIMNKIFIQGKILRYSAVFFLSALLTISLYLSYPRQDSFFNSRGYSTGRRDFEVVDWIEKDSRGQKYLVLANQQVSVAALSRFGFSRYLKNDLYFYPIPTGGQLYQYYLKMTYEEPSPKIMRQAMQETDTEQAYFVLNKYWWAFPKVLEEAKLSAKSWQEIGENEVFIFKFTK